MQFLALSAVLLVYLVERPSSLGGRRFCLSNLLIVLPSRIFFGFRTCSLLHFPILFSFSLIDEFASRALTLRGLVSSMLH
ncbi:hypothetical protein DL96DRAFT_1631170 [Flagelloscypha sp. PMI_526]|nr:hypothetical protein DL96DRAFT_1631170 [Flagelloscypha sp. PMI_526]